MAKSPKKPAAERSLEDLLRLFRQLRARSVKLAAEAKALNAKTDKIAERVKRLLDQHGG